MTRHLYVLLLLAGSCAWAPAAGATAPWYNNAWGRRLEIVAKPTQINGSGAFSNFTLVLKLNGANHATVFTHAKADGSDLVVTAGDGATVLGHEIVSYSVATQSAEIWFKAPTLSTFSNRFYLYFGNPSASTVPVAGAAWTNQHLAVYHFSDNPGLGILKDFGPHANFGTTSTPANWTAADVGSGQIGQGWTFNGQTQLVDGDQIGSTTGTYTISAWFSMVNLDHDANFAFSAEVGFWHLSAKRNGEQKYADLATSAGDMSWQPQLLDSALHHFVWTLDATADTARFYFDGTEQPVFTWYAPSPPFKVYTGEVIQGNVGIGGPLFDDNFHDMLEGLADEFHVYEGLRSPAWIKTEYNNQKNPVGFFTYLEQTSGAAAVDPITASLLRVTASPNPLRDVTEIAVDGGRDAVEIIVYDIAGRRIRQLSSRAPSTGTGALRLLWDGRDDVGHAVGNGVYYVRAISGVSTAGTKVLLVR